MNKTEAIRIASRHVNVCGSGTSWQIISPYSELDGPTTSSNATSYKDATTRARKIKATIVLELLGKMSDDALHDIYHCEATTLREILNTVLNKPE